MESQNKSGWKGPHEVSSPSASSKQGQLEVGQDCSGLCSAGPWKPPRKETAQSLGALLHCSDGLMVPPVSSKPTCTASLGADSGRFPCRKRCPTPVTCCILLVTRPQTEVSSPGLLPGNPFCNCRSVGGEGAFCLLPEVASLQPSLSWEWKLSLFCSCGFYVFLKIFLVFVKRTQLNNPVVNS